MTLASSYYSETSSIFYYKGLESVLKEKYDIELIGFISNVFMCYFKLNNVLSIISYSVGKEKYELDFAMCEYDSINEQQYKEAITEGFADVWKKDGIDEEI